MSTLVPVANHFFDFVTTIDPRRATWDELSKKALTSAKTLKQEIDDLLERPAESMTAKVAEALAAASRHLDEFSEAVRDKSGFKRWRTIYGSLARAYEQLTSHLKRHPGYQGHAFSSLRKRNFGRNAFHMSGGLVAALAYHFFLTRRESTLIMSSFAGVSLLLEILRRYVPSVNDALMRFPLFSHCARPHEFGRVNSSTYYVLGLWLSVLAFPRLAVEIGAITLALADPIASNIGRAVGRTKLRSGKSLEGSLGFILTGFVAVSVYLTIVSPEISLSGVVTLAAIAGVAGAVTELLSTKLDDNLTIPLGVASVASLASALGLVVLG